jgi:hypothetical protein
LSLPKRGIQVTMLTRSGPFLITAAPKTVVSAGGALMLELMRRSEERGPVAAADQLGESP